MELRNKIIAGLIALGITTGATVVGLDQACVFDTEVVEHENLKICFEKEADYKKFKDDLIGKYQQNTAGFYWTIDGHNFMAMLSYEMKKRNSLQFNKFNKNTNLIEDVLRQVK